MLYICVLHYSRCSVCNEQLILTQIRFYGSLLKAQCPVVTHAPRIRYSPYWSNSKDSLASVFLVCLFFVFFNITKHSKNWKPIWHFFLSLTWSLFLFFFLAYTFNIGYRHNSVTVSHCWRNNWKGLLFFVSNIYGYFVCLFVLFMCL